MRRLNRERTGELSDTVAKVASEINTGLRQVLMDLHGNSWMQAPEILEDCRYIIDELRKAEVAIAELRQNVMTMSTATEAMHKEWQRSQVLTMPLTMGDHVKIMTIEFLKGNWEEPVLDVDRIHEKLEAQGVYLGVKNPRAVLSSILGRDERLKWISPGRFEKKVPEGETQTAPKD